MASLAELPVGSRSTTIRSQLWLGSRYQAPLALLLLFAFRWVTAQNPRDNFCRRFAHQTTVIDDKLYIDGGWVNLSPEDHKNSSNTWLGYHDLNHPVIIEGLPWPDLNISLKKNYSIPTVNGGVLWGDDINKRFYLYGGDWNNGFAESNHLYSYDILYDQWDDFGPPNIDPPPDIASYGAGVGVSETGMGYYYGGWISNASMSGWTEPQKMSSSFYAYAYDTGNFTQRAGPDHHPRAEGAMVWIPAGDTKGLLIYMGGIISPHGNSTTTPQPFNEIFVFDATGNSWSNQTATGEIPQNRRRFCIDVAWAPDKSSFNIYLWGGHSVPPPAVNVTSFNDVYILTLPSFIWVKVSPDHHGNATLPYGHYSASCNIVKSMSQVLFIGGTYPDTNDCDARNDTWAQRIFWTGTLNNDGDNEAYFAPYDSNVTSNVVPVDVYSIVGGSKYGGATLTRPKAGFDSGNKLLQKLLGQRPLIPQRSPTRNITVPTNPPTSSRSRLSTGAIVGIAIGSAVGLVLIVLVWYWIGRRVVRRREERRQSKTRQASYGGYSGASTAVVPNIVSPQTSRGPWEIGSGPRTPQLASSLPPSELPTKQNVSELPQQREDNNALVGVPLSQAYSPAPAPSLTPEVHT